MVKIGITGGIGSGKSVVAELLRNMGYPVFDTDREAKLLMEKSDLIRSKLTALFGPQTYEGRCLNRAYLASHIFTDENARLQVNAIVHPEVRRYFFAWCESQDAPVVFFESAILYESDFHQAADRIWVVIAPDEVRIERTVSRDKTTPKQVRARMDSQLSQAEKEARADYIIHNDGKEALIPQVLVGLEKIRDI